MNKKLDYNCKSFNSCKGWLGELGMKPWNRKIQVWFSCRTKLVSLSINGMKWIRYMLLLWALLLMQGCFSNVNQLEDINDQESYPVLSKIMRTPHDLEDECNIYINWRLSAIYTVEINLLCFLNQETGKIEYMDSRPLIILRENNTIIAVNQIPENMDGDRKIIQSIEADYDERDQSLKVNFNIEVVDNNLKTISKQGSIILQIDREKMEFTIKEYSLH